jgi:N6-adenosine-specific RNA methylase IME4
MKSVLWQSDDKTVVLIDVPGSISAAQGSKEEPCTHLLQSSQPLLKPFSIAAPKPATAEAKCQDAVEADAALENHRIVLEAALEVVRSHCTGQWCLPRQYTSEKDPEVRAPREQPAAKRKLQDMTTNMPGGDVPSNLCESVLRPSLIPLECRVEAQNQGAEYDCDYEPGSNLWTSTTSPATLTITSHVLRTATSSHHRFRLPPKSLAFLSDCLQPRSFHELARERNQKFEFILLDPPWPNRSVKRTQKSPGNSYSTTKLGDMDTMLCGLNLPSLLAGPGSVGVWITNKPAVRDFVLGSGGLFKKWDISLVEEWTWLKITVNGEASSPLRDAWNGKKPYEILLIGSSGHFGASNTVKSRVIVGVPDLHSRKPCLKELIEDLVGTEATVLEIFARNLVSGWWSWGNECLKYNWDGYWRETDEAAELAELQPSKSTPSSPSAWGTNAEDAGGISSATLGIG